MQQHTRRIKEMYRLLSTTDIKTICKNRKLPVNQHINADTFSNFFRSSIGVDHAISQLSPDEITTLLLIKEDASLDTSNYAIIYPEANHYGTFTQKYQHTYKSVIHNFVKKGILIVDDINSGDSKLERIRFTFPSEFKSKLPAPFSEILEEHREAETCDTVLRGKVSRIYNGQPAIKNNLYIENGLLQFNLEIFQLSALDQWRQESLEQYIIKEYRNSKGYNAKNTYWKQVDIVKVLLDAFARLKNNQFVSSEGINSIFRLIYGNYHEINLEDILTRIAELGFLSRITLANKHYYQYKNSLAVNTIQAEDYLVLDNNRFAVSVSKIPYKALEELAFSCNFAVENKILYITPDFSRLVRIYHTFKNTDLFNYLKQNSKLLSSKIDEIEEKHGKVLLHSNLLIAKVNDFKLQAILTKAYQNSDAFIFLPNDYVAFTKGELINITNLVTKSGFAIKKFVV